MIHTARDPESLVSLADVTEIELIILKRMREVTIGDHRSRSHGAGFDFIGLREWQAGDKLSSIDWAQSSLTNFSPLVVREFEQPSTATIAAIADVSLSTRCGIDGRPIAAGVAHAIATIGLSAVFFQDPFGLVTFDEGFAHLASVRPRTGKSHVVHCLDAYQRAGGADQPGRGEAGVQAVRRAGSISATLSGCFRRSSMLAVISDFLFPDADATLRELALVNAQHDVFIVLVDARFAFEVPDVSSGWVDVVDVETGRTRTISRRTLRGLAARVREHQDQVRSSARDAGLDVVELGPDQTQADIALGEFVAERRLRRTRM